MSVGFHVGINIYMISSSDFLHSFFSTVAYHLENKKWGKKYPYIMKKLYKGRLKNAHVDYARSELTDIKMKLSELSPDNVIWDIENLAEQPPWGNDITDTITSLANYFVTSDGEDFIEVFEQVLAVAKETQEDVAIR